MTPARSEGSPQLRFYPADKKRWKDLEKLFGKNGACAGCWCMWWKQSAKEFSQNNGEKNEKLLKRRIESGEVPGILVYHKDQPMAWIAVEPREAYPRLERSRTLKKVDDKPVWSVVCFFIAKEYRRQGASAQVLKAAVDYARKQGAKIIEGYPNVTKNKKWPDPWLWMGLASVFQKAKFVEVLRRSKSKPIMRYYVRQNRN